MRRDYPDYQNNTAPAHRTFTRAVL